MRTAFVGLLMSVLLVAGPPAARGAERAGDSLALYALKDRTYASEVLARDLLAVIEASPDEDRFELYRTYGALVGAWLQVDLTQALIEEAVAATAPSEEQAIRTTLRDQAQFALWELDQAHAYLDRNSADRGDLLRITPAIHALLFEAQAILGRVLAEQCTYVGCSSGP